MFNKCLTWHTTTVGCMTFTTYKTIYDILSFTIIYFTNVSKYSTLDRRLQYVDILYFHVHTKKNNIEYVANITRF